MEWYLKCIKQHYFDFNGRARRKEYWMFTLFNVLITIALCVMLSLISQRLIPLANLYSLAVMLPGLGVTVRRLHDINKSGWMFFLAFIPLVNFYLIYLLCQDSNERSNYYGANPKA
ncbi:DUF805 domain-containing protein [Pseudomonas sp. C9-3]|uniref:DUF805 domain-containing protein n=1 Tax=Pseudomonas sp. C9-3 TaxID=3078264 RepID=UPI0028EAACF8|nr:DUF805 domain-containing protein [Pseudomonas sp. C9-3]